MTFVNALKDSSKTNAIVEDAAKLVEAEVASKTGFAGLTLKGAFRAFRKIRPGITAAALRRLLPHFAPILDENLEAAGESRELYFQENAAVIAEALLAVTDKLASKASNRVMKKIYSGLRKSALPHVQQAVPKVPGLAQRHLV